VLNKIVKYYNEKHIPLLLVEETSWKYGNSPTGDLVVEEVNN
jgi:hypothetical protein